MFSAPPIDGHPLTSRLLAGCKGRNKIGILQELWRENFPVSYFCGAGKSVLGGEEKSVVLRFPSPFFFLGGISLQFSISSPEGSLFFLFLSVEYAQTYNHAGQLHELRYGDFLFRVCHEVQLTDSVSLQAFYDSIEVFVDVPIQEKIV